MKEREKLIEITAAFLEEKTDYLKLTGAAKEYKNMLVALAELEDDDTGRKDLQFDNGKALGTTWAAMCIDDFMRTTRFIRGLFKAVRFLKATQKRPIHILYAGSGPFAALILPLTTQFTEQEIRFTILEINPNSYQAVQKLISRLGIDGYFIAVENADATKYRVDAAVQVDILVSETMQPALAKEQQVSIMMNLLKQLPAGVIAIPQKVELELALLNSKKHMQALNGEPGIMYYRKAGLVFELSKESIVNRLTQLNREEEIVFPEVTIKLSPGDISGYNLAVVITEIQVYEEERLSINESGITLTKRLDDLDHLQGKEITLTFQYKIDAEPGLKYSIQAG